MFCIVEKDKFDLKYSSYILYENEKYYYLPRHIKRYINNNNIYLYEDASFSTPHHTGWKFTSQLRPEQKEIMSDLITLYEKDGYINGIIHARPGFGKTISSIYLATYLSTTTLVIIDTKKIMEQWKEEIIRHTDLTVDDIGFIQGDKFDVENKKFIITTPQTLASKVKRDIKENYKIFRELGIGFVIWDECLSADTEILTECGWQRFDMLDRSIKVAQFNNQTEEVSFVHPLKYIENDYNGELVNLVNKNIDLLATPNHDQLIKTYTSYHKVNVDDIKFTHYNSIPVYGKATGTLQFTDYHRFLLMLQADGTIQWINKNGNRCQVSFAFSKTRKIDRFINILNNLGWEYNEIKPHLNKRRFLVYPTNIEVFKNFNEWIEIINLSYEFCNEFINELTQWDGSTKENRLYYSTTNKNNADIVAQIACLGGFKFWNGVSVDNRKVTHKDCYRFRFYKDATVSTQSIKKSYINYNDKVYCVKVPTGNIIIRRNNKVMITGNCHKMGQKFASASLLFNTLNLLGLSATPYNPKERDTLIKSMFNDVIVRYGEYDFQPLIKFVHYNSGLGSTYGKRVCFMWDKDFIQGRSIYNSKLHESTEWINQIYNITKFETDNNNKIIIMCMTQLQLEFICNFLENKGLQPTKLYSKKHEIDKTKDDIIVATYKYASHAFDYKELSRLILAVPLSGKKSLIQTIGRVVRSAPGKTDAIVYDLIDIDNGFRKLFVNGINTKINILNSEFDNCKFETVTVISN